jgi:tyrosine decarboxylase/aspartate 1-decarboxylase
MANLEALWVAGQLNPGKKIVASAQSHYTHKRISAVLQLGFESAPCDARGRMDIAALEQIVRRGEVGTVVATMGTTATGAVDPLPEILGLSEKYNFRVHADCAYGGYFILAQNLEPDTAKSIAHIGQADSIVIDPHKHGLQPYGCGCVLLRDPALGRLYKHDSPYTYFSSTELHLGEISLECSRPGAAAAALWATQKLLPLTREGDFSKDLERSRAAAKKLFAKVDGDSRFVTAFPPELDLVIFAPRAASVSEASVISRKIFDTAAKQNLYLAVVELPTAFFKAHLADMKADRETIACLRCTLMKPEHLDWLEQIWQRFELAYAEAI